MIDTTTALRNVMTQLQEQPQRYSLFGVYWWGMKKALIAGGYGPEQLYLLGPYVDLETAALAPELDAEPFMEAAFTEYGFNARYPHLDNQVEAPDGELVTIFDADAGF